MQKRKIYSAKRCFKEIRLKPWEIKKTMDEKMIFSGLKIGEKKCFGNKNKEGKMKKKLV